MILNRMTELLAIKGRHEGRNISLLQCAKETGLSYSTLKKWKAQDVTRRDDPIVEGLCKYFDCGIEDLLIIVEDEPSPESKTPLLATA